MGITGILILVNRLRAWVLIGYDFIMTRLRKGSNTKSSERTDSARLIKIGPHYIDLENHALSDYWAEDEDKEFWAWWDSLTEWEKEQIKGR